MKIIKNFLISVSLFLFCFNAFAATLADAQKDYLRGDYEGAAKKAKTLRQNDENLYFLGLVYIKTANYKKARDYLRKLMSRYPNSVFWPQGAVKLADSYFLEKNYPKAERIYKELLEKDSLDNMPSIYLRLAQIAGRRGDWEEKNKYVSLIKEKYPQSPEMKFIGALEGYGDFFTIQVGAFSEKSNALSLFNDLSKEYKPYIVEEKKNGYLLHKVRVGRFKRAYEARKVYSELRNQGYPARIYP